MTWGLKFLILLTLSPLLYGLLLSLVLSPTNVDVNAYHESRILLMQQQQTYFLNSFNDICEVVYGLGYDLVLHNHLRFGEDRGLGIYGYVSFICIAGFLFNFYNTKNTINKWFFLPAIFFLGLIEPVYQSFSAKNDLPSVLACVASFHLFVKWKDSPSGLLMLLSFLAIIWAVSCKKVYLAFALPMILIWTWELIKDRTHFKFTKNQILTSFILIFFASPILIYIYNIFLWGNWSGPEVLIKHAKNQSFIIGTAGNFFRYLLEIFHLPAFVDDWILNNNNFSLVNLLNRLWETFFLPIFGNHGETTYTFKTQWIQSEDSWFGPLGVVLLFCFFSSLIKNNTHSNKCVLFISGFYFICICNQLSWKPFNDRFFTLFFIMCSLLISTEASNYTKGFTKFIILPTSLILLNWSIFFNQNNPTLNFFSLNLNAVFEDIKKNSVLVKTDFGKTKLGFAKIPIDVINNIEKNSKISIWITGYQPIAFITRQLDRFDLQPLRFRVVEGFKVDETIELTSQHLLESDYHLHIGKKVELVGDTVKLVNVWKSEISDGEYCSLSKVIHPTT